LLTYSFDKIDRFNFRLNLKHWYFAIVFNF